MLQTIVGQVLIFLGVGLIAAAVIGLIRLPDLFNRTNAVAKAAALGVSLVLIGVLVLMPSLETTVVLLLAVAAQLFTAPMAGYAVGRAGFRSGAPFASITYRNDLTARSSLSVDD